MATLFRRHLYAQLAAASISLVAGTAGAATILPEIPPEVLSDLIDNAEQADAHDRNRGRVLGLLAKDTRSEIRAQVAEATGVLWPEDGEVALAVLRDLARDASSQVRSAAAVGLARIIQRSHPKDRIELVCQWALSENAGDRSAVAHALRWSTPVLVADLVIEQLANDPSAQVRATALKAAAAHFSEYPAAYSRIAARLVADPDRTVRRAARRLLNRRA